MKDLPPARLERATHSLEGCCSIQLSYGSISVYFQQLTVILSSPLIPLCCLVLCLFLCFRVKPNKNPRTINLLKRPVNVQAKKKILDFSAYIC